MKQVTSIGELLGGGVGRIPGTSSAPAPAAAMVTIASRRPIGRARGRERAMRRSLSLGVPQRFVYHQSVDASDLEVASIASAIGEAARARILYCLLDGR